MNMQTNAPSMNSLFSLEGKTALVAGGSGAIGFALARGLGEFGARVALMGREEKRLKAAAARLEDLGVEALALRGDILSEQDCRDAVEGTVGRLGGLNIVLDAAEVYRRFPAEGFPEDEFSRIQNVNVRGTFLLFKAASAAMMQGGGGRMIALTSARADVGHPLGYSAYAASKGAVNALVRQLAVEWAKHDILVNAISHSLVITPGTEQVFTNLEQSGVFTGQVALRRAALPEELIGTAVYLASSASNFVTGEIVHVHGGDSVGAL